MNACDKRYPVMLTYDEMCSTLVALVTSHRQLHEPSFKRVVSAAAYAISAAVNTMPQDELAAAIAVAEAELALIEERWERERG